MYTDLRVCNPPPPCGSGSAKPRSHTCSSLAMTSSYNRVEGTDLQDLISAVRGQSDSILVYNADDFVAGVDGDDRVVLGLGNDTLTIFGQSDLPGFAFSLNGAEIYGDGFPNALEGGSVANPSGDDSIDLTLPGRGPSVFLGATNTLIDAGAGVDTIQGWTNIELSTLRGGEGTDTIRWGYGITINGDRISSSISGGLFEGGLAEDTIVLQANQVVDTTIRGADAVNGPNDGDDSIVVEGYAGTNEAINVEVERLVINGNAGEDSIRVGDLNTSSGSAALNIRDSEIRGGKNNDTIEVGARFDLVGSTVYGDANADFIAVSAGRDIIGGSIWGGSPDDTTDDQGDLIAIQSGNRITGNYVQGNGGNDTIAVVTSLLDNSTIRGGKDEDDITVEADTITVSQVFGDRGSDTIDVSATNIQSSSIFGGSFEDTTNDGADFISVAASATITNSLFRGNGGADTIDIQTPLFSRSSAEGGKQDDSVSIGNGTSAYEIRNSVISGDLGNDTLFVGGSNGVINSSSIYGGNADLTTGTGDDLISIQASITNSLVDAGDGDDTISITGNVNNSTIIGGEEIILGGLTSSTLNGSAGNDDINVLI